LWVRLKSVTKNSVESRSSRIGLAVWSRITAGLRKVVRGPDAPQGSGDSSPSSPAGEPVRGRANGPLVDGEAFAGELV
jgi:hypothetical protein